LFEFKQVVFISEPKSIDRPASEHKNALDAEMGLRYKVTDWASLNLKAEKDLIRGTEDSDLDKTRYTVGFGVTW
ncbi:DUF481 domain-containing protein, partial [Stenotrophomonas maltophilia]|uniref:DUF481 domain-containing protein n=1 Tax=Stenotrophomonas maltophilia TaxID=40324 RepID=UPI0031451076